MKDLSPHDVEEAVNERLEAHELARALGARALPGTARLERWGWTVSVGTERDPERTSRFLDELSAVADELLEQTKLEVLIAPSGVRPSEALGRAQESH